MKACVVVFVLAPAFLHVNGQPLDQLRTDCPVFPPPADCTGEGLIICPGPVDPLGCVGPSSCMPDDKGCPTPVKCPELPSPDCDQDAMICPGGMDLLECPAPDFCAPNGETCEAVGTK